MKNKRRTLLQTLLLNHEKPLYDVRNPQTGSVGTFVFRTKPSNGVGGDLCTIYETLKRGRLELLY
ncbi:MAG: hypothetical protein LBS43_00170, partial [Prevotellaceae bacterium]|nr:hypothetical protein [Prevotellaceae bacterium]